MPLERDTALVAVRVEHGADAPQVAEPLLADGRREQHGTSWRPRAAARWRPSSIRVARATQLSPMPGPCSRPRSRARVERRAAGKTVSRCAATTIAGPAGRPGRARCRSRRGGLEARLGQARRPRPRARTPRTSARGWRRGRACRGRGRRARRRGERGRSARYAADSSRGAAMRLIAGSLFVASSAATLYDSASVG